MKTKNKSLARKSFAELFADAKQGDEYWVAEAIYTFTEELHHLAEMQGLSRADLARLLGVSPAYITKIFRGDVNFTIETMVRLARAVGASLDLHLTPLAPPKGRRVPRPAAVGVRELRFSPQAEPDLAPDHEEA